MTLPHKRIWTTLAWFALVVALGSASSASQLVPSSSLSQNVVEGYVALASQTPLSQLSPRDAYSAVYTLQFAQRSIPPTEVTALCSKATQFAESKVANPRIEDAYYYLLLSKALKCPVGPLSYAKNSALIEALKLGVQSDILQEAYLATMTVLESNGSLRPEDYDLSDAALLAADIINPDGTGRIAVNSLTSSLGNAGLAYELLGKVAVQRTREGMIEADTDLKSRLRQAVDKIKSSFSYLVKSDSNPVTNRGLAALIKGASALAASVEEALPLAPEAVFNLFARAMDQQYAMTMDNARATLEIVSSATATPSEWAIYAVVASSNAPIGSDELPSASKLSYSCVDLRGRPIPAAVVRVQSVVQGSSAAPGAQIGQGADALKSLDNERAGVYTAWLIADVSAPEASSKLLSSSTLNRVQFPKTLNTIPRAIFRVGSITSASVNAFVSQKEFGVSGSSEATKAAYPSTLSKPLQVDVSADKYFRILLDAAVTEGAEFFPVATISSSDNSKTVSLPFSVGSASGSYISSIPIPQDLSSLASGKYALRIILGGHRLRSVSWKVAEVVLTNSNPRSVAVPGALPESKAYTFAAPESRPFSIISLIFAVLFALPLVVLVKYLISTRSSVPLLPGEGATRVIFLAEVAFLALGFNIIYWVKLNIIQAIAVIAVVALPVALGVRNALVAVRQRKGLAIEAVSGSDDQSNALESEPASVVASAQQASSATASSVEVDNKAEKKRKNK